MRQQQSVARPPLAPLRLPIEFVGHHCALRRAALRRAALRRAALRRAALRRAALRRAAVRRTVAVDLRSWRWMGPFFAALLLVASPRSAAALDQWYLELRHEGIDRPAAERSVALELRDLEVPGDPSRTDDSQDDVSLYFRVELTEQGLFVVLWDRGAYIAKRRISEDAHPKLLARRVGLAAAELAIDLKARRQRLAGHLEKERLHQKEVMRRQRDLEKKRALTLASGLSGFGLFRGAWALGPHLGFSANQHYPLRFSGFLAWRAGRLPQLSSATLAKTAPSWSQWETGASAQWVFARSPKASAGVGLFGAVSAVHVGGAAELDGISGQRDSYSARGGLQLEWSQALSERASTTFGLQAGSILRAVPVRYAEQELRMGGAFFGLSLGAMLLPSGD